MESYYGHPEERNVVYIGCQGPSPKNYGPNIAKELLEFYVESSKFDEKEKDTMFDDGME